MMESSVSEILNRWPDRKAILEDVRAVDGELALVAVHRWFTRSSVPGKYWSALIRGAQERGIAVSAEDLVRAHDPNEVKRGAA